MNKKMVLSDIGDDCKEESSLKFGKDWGWKNIESNFRLLIV